MSRYGSAGRGGLLGRQMDPHFVGPAIAQLGRLPPSHHAGYPMSGRSHAHGGGGGGGGLRPGKGGRDRDGGRAPAYGGGGAPRGRGMRMRDGPPPSTPTLPGRDRERDRDFAGKLPSPAAKSPLPAGSPLNHPPLLAANLALPAAGAAQPAATTPQTSAEDRIEVELPNIHPVARASALLGAQPYVATGDSDGSITFVSSLGEPTCVFTLPLGVPLSALVAKRDYLFVASHTTLLVFSVAELETALARAADDARIEAELKKNSPDPTEDAGKPRSRSGSPVPGDKGKKAENAAEKEKEKEREKEVAKRGIRAAPVARCAVASPIAVSLAVVEAGGRKGHALYVGDSAGAVATYLFHPDTATLAAGAETWQLHKSNVTGVLCDGSRLMTCSHDGSVLFTDVKEKEPHLQLMPCLLEETRTGRKRTALGIAKSTNVTIACAVSCIAMDSDKLWLAVGGDVPYVSIVCLTTGRVRNVFRLPNPDWKVRSVNFIKADVVVGVDDNYVLTYSLSGKLLASRLTASDTVHTIAASDESSVWAVSGKNGNIDIFRS
ncbi:hypothetical protein DIPPA_19489 [Diplonema papillatum]|nr:hypothetical protein DIPPA_19489 [Diplonema papillatum]